MFSSTEIDILDDNDINFRQRLFAVHEFHYLNVLPVGVRMVYDDLDCTFKCLYHPTCISVNLVAEGGLWCELLSSDKYSNPKEFKQNKSSHHYQIIVRTTWTENVSFLLCCVVEPYEINVLLTTNNSCHHYLFVVVVLTSLGIVSLILSQFIALLVALFQQSMRQWWDLRSLPRGWDV